MNWSSTWTGTLIWKKSVKKHSPVKAPASQSRAVAYWSCLLPLYKQETARLFKQDSSLQKRGRFSLKDDRRLAYRLADHRAQLLDPNNKKMLQEIYQGIYGDDDKKLKEDLQAFNHQVKINVQGERGENSVTEMFDREETISSVNLPYSYGRKGPNSNQVDSIIVNRHGIFILEVKSYSGQAIGIDKNGRITVKNGRKYYKHGEIIKQGMDHLHAAEDSLKKDLIPKEWQFLQDLKSKKQTPIRVLYVSAKEGVAPMKAPAGKPYYRFMTPAQVKAYINKLPYLLADFAVQDIRNAFANRQLVEKQYPHLNFPEDMSMTAQDSGQELVLMESLLECSLDKLVEEKQPGLLQALSKHGYTARNGIVSRRKRRKVKQL